MAECHHGSVTRHFNFLLDIFNVVVSVMGTREYLIKAIAVFVQELMSHIDQFLGDMVLGNLALLELLDDVVRRPVVDFGRNLQEGVGIDYSAVVLCNKLLITLAFSEFGHNTLDGHCPFEALVKENLSSLELFILSLR
jgi:hypothetical protein